MGSSATSNSSRNGPASRNEICPARSPVNSSTCPGSILIVSRLSADTRSSRRARSFFRAGSPHRRRTVAPDSSSVFSRKSTKRTRKAACPKSLYLLGKRSYLKVQRLYRRTHLLSGGERIRHHLRHPLAVSCLLEPSPVTRDRLFRPSGSHGPGTHRTMAR